MKQQLPPLLGGVSQLPDTRKDVLSLRSCTNFLPDSVRGLCKRPGSFDVGSLGSDTMGTWLDARLGDNDHFLLRVARDGAVVVWDALTGSPITTTNADPTYLEHTTQGDLDMVAVGDIIFVVNRTKIVAMTSDEATGDTDWGFFQLDALLYDHEYEVTVNNITYTFDSPDTGTLSSTDILDGLADLLPQTTWREGETVFIESPGSVEGSIFVKASTSTIPSPQSLPETGRADFVITVQPPAGTPYYLKWETDKWVEVSKPGEKIQIDPATMPHRVFRVGDQFVIEPVTATTSVASTTVSDAALTASPDEVFGAYFLGQIVTCGGVYLRVDEVDQDAKATVVTVIRSDGGYSVSGTLTSIQGDTFTVDTIGDQDFEAPPFATNNWVPRAAGDDESSPPPSYVGSRITGIGYFANRLVMLSTDNVVCSRAADPFNFFPSSAEQVLSDDPVDLNAGSTVPLEFRFAREYNGQLICIGDEQQYALVGRDGLFSPITAQLTVSNRLRASSVVPPAALGQSWAVLQPSPGGTRIVEFRPNSDSDPNLSAPQDLTIQVPTFIPRGVIDVAADPDLQLLTVLSVNESRKLYSYKWQDTGRERVLSAWVDMELSEEILTVYFAEETLWCVVRRGANVALVQFDNGIFNPSGRLTFEGQRFFPRLDFMRFLPPITQNTLTEETVVTAPDGHVVFNLTTYETYQNRNDSNAIVVPGLYAASELVTGVPYVASTILPDIFPIIEQSRQSTDTVKLQRLEVLTDGSTGFEALVQSPGRNSFRYIKTTQTAGSYQLGSLNMKRNSRHRFTVLAQSDNVTITLEAPSVLHTAINQVAWEGTVNAKQRT